MDFDNFTDQTDETRDKITSHFKKLEHYEQSNVGIEASIFYSGFAASDKGYYGELVTDNSNLGIRHVNNVNGFM